MATSLCNAMKNVSFQCLHGKRTFVSGREGPAGLQELLEPQQMLNGDRNQPGSSMTGFKAPVDAIHQPAHPPGLGGAASFRPPLSKALFEMINQRAQHQGGVHLLASSGQGRASQQDGAHAPRPRGLVVGLQNERASNQPQLGSGKSRFPA